MNAKPGLLKAYVKILSALTVIAIFQFGEDTYAQPKYQKPPKVVTDVLNAPPTPTLSMSPARDRMLLVQGVGNPSIADLAEPMLRLAGLRMNPNTNGPFRTSKNIGLTLKSMADSKEVKLALPPNANISSPSWSADGKFFAFTNTTASGIELWAGNAVSGAVRRIPGVVINAAYGQALNWMPDNKTLLVQTVVAGRGKPPQESHTPAGPNIQESSGKPAPIKTFQDLLTSSHDEALFEYYATSQLALVDIQSGRLTPVGKPGIYSSADPSPDGQFILTERTHKPFSYLLMAYAFPKEVEIWDLKGKPVHKVTSLPLAEQVPVDGVLTGPRSYHWRPTESATLVWAEALDNGDPRQKADYRDRVMMLKAPFQGQATEIAKTEQRFRGIRWLEDGKLAFVQDFDRDRRWNRTFIISPDNPGQAPRQLWSLSMNERYKDPGNPLTKVTPRGTSVILQDGDSIYLSGTGASPKGDRPFLDRLNLATLKTERVFQSDEQSYETVVSLVAEDASRFITRYETSDTPPNYFLRSTGGSAKQALTNFPDPAPQLRGVKKQIVTYKRDDGVQLSFTLYLPPGYKEGQRLPTVIWAYPREFGDADTAGQISGSAHRFTTLNGASHLFFLTQGYAILDNATMPVIGDAETMNNTYIEQTVSSAKAAIDKAVEMGVTDRNRVGVGGHSYGAFMTANLLAHSDLFRAGIARSGAYNRTLTPFGFQSERRILWEAPEMYIKISPFMYANKINEPILLIHGEADNNMGTFPIQSERMYQALKGNGATVRYVTLPHESHSYAARESLEHVLYEMITWFDKYVKNGPRQDVEATGRN